MECYLASSYSVQCISGWISFVTCSGPNSLEGIGRQLRTTTKQKDPDDRHPAEALSMARSTWNLTIGAVGLMAFTSIAAWAAGQNSAPKSGPVKLDANRTLGLP